MSRMVLVTAVLLQVACMDVDKTCEGADTCGDGDNLTNPSVAGFVSTAETDYELSLTWERGTGLGAELPDEYFADVTLSGASAIRAQLTGEREITVLLRFDILDPGQREMRFTLWFPDRWDFLECRHPGSPDSYYLIVQLAVDESGSIVSSSFEQGRQLGPC